MGVSLSAVDEEMRQSFQALDSLQGCGDFLSENEEADAESYFIN